MSVDDLVNIVTNKFEEYFQEFYEKDIITADHLRRYGELSKNTHSLLQYLLIKAGIDAGYYAVPEVKFKFKDEPEFVWRNKKRHFKKVDVAFARCENSKLVYKGFGEIYTIDGSFQCVEKNIVEKALKDKAWIPARDLLIHLVKNYDKNINKWEYLNLEFAIIVVVLPKISKTAVWRSELEKLKNGLNNQEPKERVLKEKLQHFLYNKNGKKKNYNYYEAFAEHWRDLNRELNKCIKKSKLLIITEKDESNKFDVQVE
jgi:hypothetical protein